MNPKPIDSAQTSHESLPTVAATAPIENSTSGGTPLATQNAPVQSMPRSSPATGGAGATTVSSAAMFMRFAQNSTGSRRPRPIGFVGTEAQLLKASA